MPRTHPEPSSTKNKVTYRDRYPEIYLAYKPLHEIHYSSHMALITVPRLATHWHFSTHRLRLPENASQILDFSPARTPDGPGMFVLYAIQGKTKLLYSATDTRYSYIVSMEAPEGARCIASLVEDGGRYTSLLVGGRGPLRHWTAWETGVRDAPGTAVATDVAFVGLSEMFPAQSESGGLTIFAHTHDEAVIYASSAGWSTAKPSLKVVELVRPGEGGTCAPFVPRAGLGSASRLNQQLFVAMRSGQLKLLDQDAQKGFWQETPFFVPALEEIVEYQAYMVRVAVADENDRPLSEQSLLLTSSAAVEVLANGRSIVTSDVGDEVITDGDGTLTLVIPTDALATSSVTVAVLSDDAVRSLSTSVEIDPADKVFRQLEDIESADDLKNVRMQSGKGLLEGKDISDSDLHQAAHGVKSLVTARNEAKDKSFSTTARQQLRAEIRTLPTRDMRIVAGQGGQALLEEIEEKRQSHQAAASVGPEARGWLGGFIVDIVGEIAFGVWDKIKQWASWALVELDRIGGKIRAFFLKIGNTIYGWVLEAVDAITRAFEWLATKLLQALADLIDWLGFLFDWDDIQHVQGALIGQVRRFCDMDMRPVLGEVVSTVTDVLEGNPQMPVDGLPEEPVDVDNPPRPPSGKHRPGDKANVQANHSTYQLTHGGAAAGATLKDEGAARTWMPRQPLAWSGERATDALDHMFNQMFPVLDNVLTLVRDGAKMDAGSLLQKLAPAAFLPLLGGNMGDAFDVLPQLPRMILAALDQKITIPIFSKLYKLATKQDLTVLSAAALLAAIPGTLMYKIVYGESPLQHLRGSSPFLPGGLPPMTFSREKRGGGEDGGEGQDGDDAEGEDGDDEESENGDDEEECVEDEGPDPDVVATANKKQAFATMLRSIGWAAEAFVLTLELLPNKADTPGPPELTPRPEHQVLYTRQTHKFFVATPVERLTIAENGSEVGSDDGGPRTEKPKAGGKVWALGIKFLASIGDTALNFPQDEGSPGKGWRRAAFGCTVAHAVFSMIKDIGAEVLSREVLESPGWIEIITRLTLLLDLLVRAGTAVSIALAIEEEANVKDEADEQESGEADGGPKDGVDSSGNGENNDSPDNGDDGDNNEDSDNGDQDNPGDNDKDTCGGGWKGNGTNRRLLKIRRANLGFEIIAFILDLVLEVVRWRKRGGSGRVEMLAERMGEVERRRMGKSMLAVPCVVRSKSPLTMRSPAGVVADWGEAGGWARRDIASVGGARGSEERKGSHLRAMHAAHPVLDRALGEWRRCYVMSRRLAIARMKLTLDHDVCEGQDDVVASSVDHRVPLRRDPGPCSEQHP